MTEHQSGVPQQPTGQQPVTPQAPPAAQQAAAGVAPAAPATAGGWSRGRRVLAGVAAGAVALWIFGAGTVTGGLASTAISSLQADSASEQSGSVLIVPGYQDGSSSYPGYGQGQSGSGQLGSGSGTSTLPDTSATTRSASDDEQRGVVIIETELAYQSAAAAGSGIVLSSDGLILTNNHVISGSTAIRVTVPETGESYEATVIGASADEDVAVLQLQDASGLSTATLDDDGDLALGDTVTAVGNAEGEGVLVAADGEVTELDTQVTASTDGSASTAKTLDGVFEFAATVVSGDSGGAVLDADGEVVGVTTAATASTVDGRGYAIPIDRALDVAASIIAGEETDGIQIGYPAFLGVQLSSGTSTSDGSSSSGSSTGGTRQPGSSQTQTQTAVAGAQVGAVIEGTPASQIGLQAGDVITSVGGTTVASAEELSAAIGEYEPGEQVEIGWTDTAGEQHTATATLIEGPAS